MEQFFIALELAAWHSQKWGDVDFENRVLTLSQRAYEHGYADGKRAMTAPQAQGEVG